jgi:GTP pyrophosphokinase
VSWGITDPSFQASFKINGKDRLGLAGDITNLLSNDLKLNIRSISVESRGDEFEGTIRIMVSDKGYLDYVQTRLSKIEGVLKVVRL